MRSPLISLDLRIKAQYFVCRLHHFGVMRSGACHPTNAGVESTVGPFVLGTILQGTLLEPLAMISLSSM